eukprot:6212004-Pleurochrysis_carterae.AAC.6
MPAFECCVCPLRVPARDNNSLLRQVVEVIPMDVHLDFQCGLTPFWNAAQHLGLRHHAFIAYAGADGLPKVKE